MNNTDTATADFFASLGSGGADLLKSITQTITVNINNVAVDDTSLPDGVTAENFADCLTDALSELLADFGLYEANATLTIG